MKNRTTDHLGTDTFTTLKNYNNAVNRSTDKCIFCLTCKADWAVINLLIKRQMTQIFRQRTST